MFLGVAHTCAITGAGAGARQCAWAQHCAPRAARQTLSRGLLCALSAPAHRRNGGGWHCDTFILGQFFTSIVLKIRHRQSSRNAILSRSILLRFLPLSGTETYVLSNGRYWNKNRLAFNFYGSERKMRWDRVRLDRIIDQKRAVMREHCGRAAVSWGDPFISRAEWPKGGQRETQ